jgi:glycosyltransferase involved in cell wall biosynthesis
MDNSLPTVTVIIATYNKAATLRYAIDSVLWQTFQDFELWVIGDGCTDDSAEAVTSYGDPRVNWFNLPQNTGYQSEPHNEGLRRAKGRYIAYLNHDDLWLPNHLQVLVDCIEQTDADFTYSILEWILRYGDRRRADIPHYPDAARPPEASATLHRREIVAEIGYWKPPHETHAVPRAEYFRRAQFIGKRFEFAAMLTVLKFGGTDSEGYSAVGDQPEYMETIRTDPDFSHRELARLLATSYFQLDQPVSPKRFLFQVTEFARRKLIKHRIDPARLIFWHKPGHHIRDWHKAWRLGRYSGNQG